MGSNNALVQEKLRSALARDAETQATLEKARQRLDASKRALESMPNNSILANTDVRPIIGGIVVPLYFVVLAILGALVGLLRKVPEFQRRASQAYKKRYDEELSDRDENNPPITAEQAREYVVFQMLQVVTAPVIAIVAYTWVDPTNMASATLLAFAAGFSSETFLIAVRKFTEATVSRSTPKYTPRVRAGGQGTPPETGGPVPPRGQVKATVGGTMAVGDLVELVKPLGPFRPGSKGVVIAVDGNDFITVKTTENHEGMAVEFILPPQTADFFKLRTEAAPPEGPVG